MPDMHKPHVFAYVGAATELEALLVRNHAMAGECGGNRTMLSRAHYMAAMLLVEAQSLTIDPDCHTAHSRLLDLLQAHHDLLAALADGELADLASVTIDQIEDRRLLRIELQRAVERAQG